MVHNDSHISMRYIHLILLFTPIGYMLMICLMKCLSWLVGVWLRSCSTYFFGIIVFLFLLLILRYHSILGVDLGSGPEKVA